MNLNNNKLIISPEIEIIFHFELQKDSEFQKLEEPGGIPPESLPRPPHHGDVIIGNVPCHPVPTNRLNGRDQWNMFFIKLKTDHAIRPGRFFAQSTRRGTPAAGERSRGGKRPTAASMGMRVSELRMIGRTVMAAWGRLPHGRTSRYCPA